MPTAHATSSQLTSVHLESIVRQVVHTEVDRAAQGLAADLDLRESRAEAQYERRLSAVARHVLYTMAVVSWGVLAVTAIAQR
jgi:hypothetical protein